MAVFEKDFGEGAPGPNSAAASPAGERLREAADGGQAIVPPAFDLAALIAAITVENRHDVVDCGAPRGREDW